MRWVEALKIWNAEHNPGKYCVVKKGTPEYDQVRAIMGGEGAQKAKQKALEDERLASTKAAQARAKANIERGQKVREIGKRIGEMSSRRRVMKAVGKYVAQRRAKKEAAKSEQVKAVVNQKLKLKQAKSSSKWYKGKRAIPKFDYDGVLELLATPIPEPPTPYNQVSLYMELEGKKKQYPHAGRQALVGLFTAWVKKNNLEDEEFGVYYSKRVDTISVHIDAMVGY